MMSQEKSSQIKITMHTASGQSLPITYHNKEELKACILSEKKEDRTIFWSPDGMHSEVIGEYMPKKVALEYILETRSL